MSVKEIIMVIHDVENRDVAIWDSSNLMVCFHGSIHRAKSFVAEPENDYDFLMLTVKGLTIQNGSFLIVI